MRAAAGAEAVFFDEEKKRKNSTSGVEWESGKGEEKGMNSVGPMQSVAAVDCLAPGHCL